TPGGCATGRGGGASETDVGRPSRSTAPAIPRSDQPAIPPPVPAGRIRTPPTAATPSATANPSASHASGGSPITSSSSSGRTLALHDASDLVGAPPRQREPAATVPVVVHQQPAVTEPIGLETHLRARRTQPHGGPDELRVREPRVEQAGALEDRTRRLGARARLPVVLLGRATQDHE